MKTVKTDPYLGDCLEVLTNFDTDAFDLISGISPDEYVSWFMPRAEQFLNFPLKP